MNRADAAADRAYDLLVATGRGGEGGGETSGVGEWHQAQRGWAIDVDDTK